MQYAGWVSGDTLRGCRDGDAVMMALWGAGSQQQRRSVGAMRPVNEIDIQRIKRMLLTDCWSAVAGWLGACVAALV